MQIPLSVVRKGLTDEYVDLINKQNGARIETEEKATAYSILIKEVFKLSCEVHNKYCNKNAIVPARIYEDRDRDFKVFYGEDIKTNPFTHALMVEETSKKLMSAAGEFTEAFREMQLIKERLDKLVE